MDIATSLDGRQFIAQASDINLKTAQAIYVTMPDAKVLLRRATVIGRNVDTLSNGASVDLTEISGSDGVAAVAATLSTNLTGTNNDLVFTARTAGASGNSITVRYVDPATPSASISVSRSGTAITVNLATSSGTQQVETATVGGDSIGGGDVIVTVTGAGIAGSPLAINVAVEALDTAAVVGGKIRTALQATAAITAVYTVGGAAATASLTKTVAAANDATLNIDIDGTTNSTGVPDASSSADTTAGVAPAITSTAAQVKAAIEANLYANALVSIANKAANDGTGVVTAMAATALASGADPVATSTRQTLVASTDLADTDANGTTQELTLETGAKPLQPSSLLKINVSTGATATTANHDVLIEGVVLSD